MIISTTEYFCCKLKSTAKAKNTPRPANMARLGRESLRSMSGSTEPNTPASVTATRFSGATTSAASVTVASAPLTTVPTAIWVGKLAISACLLRGSQTHANTDPAAQPGQILPMHQIRPKRATRGAKELVDFFGACPRFHHAGEGLGGRATMNCAGIRRGFVPHRDDSVLARNACWQDLCKSPTS